MSVKQGPIADAPQAAHVSALLTALKARRKLIIGAGAIVLIIAAFALLSGTSNPGDELDVTTFKVRPISFPVVLKEKGEIKAKTSVDVRCEVDGQSTILWLIPEGTIVKEGDLLAELESQDIDDRIRQKEIEVADLTASVEKSQIDYEIQVDENKSNIRKAELKLRLAELELEKYQEGEYPKQRREAELAIKVANERKRRAEDDVKSSEKLYEQQYITRSALEDDKFSLYTATIEVEKANLNLEILEKYTHPAALPQKESNVTEADKELARTRKQAQGRAASAQAKLESQQAKLEIRRKQLGDRLEQRENCKIHAPASGMVVYATTGYWQSESISEGGKVRNMQTIIQLPDTSVMQVVVKVHEAKISKLKLGQRAAVTVEGMPDRSFVGTVTKIAPLAASQHRWLNPDIKEFETEITLDDANPPIKPNATAEAEIVIDYLENVLAVPIQSIYGFGGENYVFVKKGRSVEPVKVKLGISSTEYAQILDGPKQGQEVMMTISDEMKQMLAGTEENNKRQNGLKTDENVLRSLAAASQPVSRPATQPVAPTTTQSASSPASQPTTQALTESNSDQPHEKATPTAKSQSSRSGSRSARTPRRHR